MLDKKKGKQNEKIPVLITTDSTKRGVFMGFIDPKDADKETIVAKEVRMAVRWSEDVKGVIGLAANGPTAGCRITSPAKTAIIKGVTAVMELSDRALVAWRKEPWSK